VFVTLSYFSVPYYLLNYGEMHVSSGLTALLFSCMPVFILIFSALFLRERIYFSQVVGIGIGFGSLYMIIKSQGCTWTTRSFRGPGNPERGDHARLVLRDHQAERQRHQRDHLQHPAHRHCRADAVRRRVVV
jgi:hypothetical protein